MTENTKCTGMFEKIPNQFGSQLHHDCFGCKRKQIRESSSHHGFYLQPSSLFKDDKCEAKK